MNTKSLDRPPREGKDEVDLYQKFYSLAEFTSTFELPQTVRVVEGYYGPTETSKISQDTVLLVCFKKETKVVLAKDVQEMTYSIPRDSSLVYTPLDPTYGLQGHVYNSVDEMLRCAELPKVVYIDAKTAFSLRLHAGDQLVFPVKKEPNTFGKSCLVCYDQRDNKFNLPSTLCGLFSTKPDDIKMFMDDCIKFIRKFPIVVAIHDVNNTMPPGTDGSILTLTATKNEHSIVAKTISKTEGVTTRMIEIPLDIPIKLQCLQTNQQKSEAEAKKVFETYQNSAVQNHCNMAATESAYEIQNQLYTNIKPCNTRTQPERYMTMRRQVKSVTDESTNKCYEPLYENLVQHQPIPSKAPKPPRSQTTIDSSQGRRILPRQSMSLPTPSKLSTTPVPKATHMSIPPQTEPQQTQAMTETDTTKEEKLDDDIYTVIPSTAHQNTPEQDESDDYVRVLSPPTANVIAYQQQQQQLERIKKLETSNEELHTQLTQVVTQLTQLQTSVAQLLHLVVTRKPEDNIKQLSFLDTETVLVMLQAMNLSMYEHIFREHRVDGAKMARLDIKRLSQYGITNPQDQTKLIDVIKGSVSPLSYILRQSPSSSSSSSNEDSYVRFTKNY